MDRLSLSYFWSRAFLTSRGVLWTLFWINLLGTAYGYVWYWEQILDTVANKPLWMVLYVPDSPTASLFFTLSLVFLLARSYRKDSVRERRPSIWISIIDTVGLVTSFKYGIWAVAVIAAGHYYGSDLAWEDWMLSASHLGMAAEAVLFARFLSVRPASLLIAALWVFSNDLFDYRFDIFPWLPSVLLDKLGAIQIWTVVLSALSLLVFAPYAFGRRNQSV